MKNQFKKSMSLFLAVLMVLSCWVWFAAPEVAKVEAANIDVKTQYTVEINWTISDRQCDGGDIQYKTLGDGWGTESGWQTALSSMSNYKQTNTYTYSWTTTDFPTVVKITTKGGFVVSGPSRCVVNYIKINGKTVYNGSGGVAFSLPTFKTNAQASAEAYPTYNDGGNLGTTGNLGGGYSWPRPVLAGFVDSSATAADINISLSKVGGQNIEGSTSYPIENYTCYNQYGVKIANPASYLNSGKVATVKSQTTYVSGSANSDDATENTDIWAKADNQDTVVVSPNLQISDPQTSDGKATYHLVRKYVMDDTFGGEIVSKVSAAVNITYPKYTVKFDGGLSGAKITAGGDTYNGSYSPSNFAGAQITLPSETKADGYTFYEYWSKPQPTSGDASYNALEANFAKPCSTEEYNTYKSAEGSTVDANGIVTDKDNNKWYDAGVKLDPSTAKTINVEGNVNTPDDKSDDLVETWYAWWLSKDLTVKFYDVDGAFLQESTVKAGQTASAITWPTSKYVNSGYTSGSFTFKVDANIWVNTDGAQVNKNSATFTKDLILTPYMDRSQIGYTDKYDVTFVNPNGGTVTEGTDEYAYRANIKTFADAALTAVAGLGTPSSVTSAENLEFRYELLGWTSVEPTTGKNYHVLLEDADFDVNGTAIALNKDWTVRDEATYYAVYRRYTKSYVVKFTYKDATGANTSREMSVKYGATLVPPSEYVPYSYVTGGFGYTFDKWTYKTNSGRATLDYSASIPFTSDNIQIAATALDDGVAVTPIAIDATYGAGVPTPYTVTFNYVNDEGEDVSKEATVKNEQFITENTVNALAPATKWENEDKLYTFAGQWEITDGAAVLDRTNDGVINGTEKKVGDAISTADLIYITPTSNVAFKAVYANPVSYYTVTFVDGSETVTYRELAGSTIPAWTTKVVTDGVEEDKEYIPADYKGDGGTYVFQGWYDAKQTDSSFAATNGNKVVPGNEEYKVEGNITLYSQFKFVPDKYLIKFVSYDGQVQLAAREFEKGQNIEALTIEATKAAQGRAADNKYTYEFLGWDKAVPTFCEGYAVTFTAQYKSITRYYDAKWYNSKLIEDENGEYIWVADKTEDNLLATTHHTYESKVYAPSVSVVCPVTPADETQSYAFAGWYYNDADGNAVKYERGMIISGEMEFYAVYTLSDKLYTVTTVVKDEEATYSVASGEKAEIADPEAGYVDTEKHDAFAGWYTDAAYTNAFDLNTAITADIKLYAKFVESAHSFTNSELKTAPTYYAAGANYVWCACDPAATRSEEEIAMLTDTVAPTGTIYLGGHSWSSTGTPAYETDGQPISIFVNANTDIIITANDTGDVNALYNPSGAGIGVKLIRAFAFPANTVLTAENYGAAQEVATVIYENNTQALTNNANFATKVSEIFVAELDSEGNPVYNDDGSVKFGPLKDGEAYIIYYYVNDKATTDNGADATGNQLNRKVRTAKFIYDNSKPEFSVTGHNDETAVPTYCGTATVTGLEKDVVLTVDGKVVDVTYADGAETGTYAINYNGTAKTIQIVATDKAGNTFSKKIKVSDHNLYEIYEATTCTTNGYKKTYCLICNETTEEITYTSTGHSMGMPGIVPPTCTEDGYEIRKCENCDYEETTTYEELKKLGHSYAKDGNDEIIYTEVTAPTCKTEGLEEAVCITCGEGKLERAIAVDPANHEDISEESEEADCEHDGYYIRSCSCGVKLESETYPATGHGTLDEGTAEWYTTVDPTCYQTGTKELRCSKCSNAIKEDGVVVTEEIAATGEHVKTVANPDTYKEDGVVEYKCATEGCPFEYEDKELETEEVAEYTVKYVEEDGTVILTKTVVEGTYLKKGEAEASAKASTLEYKYSFAGWTDADGKVVKFPYEVTGNITLKASYKATKIMYTHKFVVPTTYTGTLAADAADEVVFATLVGGYGTERVPSGIPVFTHKDAATDAELKKLYTFEFKGWKTRAGVLVEDFTVVSDTEFVAYFEATPIKYTVTFVNGTEYVWHLDNVTAGDSVVYANKDAEGNLIVPEKAYDNNYHYVFNGWYTDEAATKPYNNGAITADTTIYAGYDAIEHSYTATVTKAATCTEKGEKTYTCTCGKTYTEEIKVVDHEYELDENGAIDYEYIEETGLMTAKCKNCDHTLSYKASVTIEFVNENEVTLQLFTNVEKNSTVSYSKEPPTKADDNANTYKFAGWIKKGDNSGKVYALNEVITAGEEDAVYVATYTASARTFTVKYVDNNNNYAIIGKVFTGLKYGDDVPAFEATADSGINNLKVPGYSTYEHYVFDKWDIDEDATVTGDLYITPVFKAVKHDCVSQGTTGATCTEKGGVEYKCLACGYSYRDTDATQPALGHIWDEGTVTLEPDYKTQTDGELTKKCLRDGCEETKIEKISGKAKSIKVTVLDANGARVQFAKVRLIKDGATYLEYETNDKGEVIFTDLAAATYSVFVAYPDGTTVDFGGTAEVKDDGSVKNGDITVQPEIEEVDDSCKCTCHKNTFWGIIFRLFQKIIKLFTGKASCCACPSDAI